MSPSRGPALETGRDILPWACMRVHIYKVCHLLQDIDRDSPAGAEPERVRREIEEVLGLDCSRAILASAKAVGPEKWLLQCVLDGTFFTPSPNQ